MSLFTRSWATAALILTFVSVAQATRETLTVDHPLVRRIVRSDVATEPLAKRWRAMTEEIRRTEATRPPELAHWTALGESLKGKTARQIARGIETELGRLPYTVDEGGDHWQNPLETARRGFKGDCEDYAILGIYVAHIAGIGPNDVAIMVGDDRRGRAHAVILIRDGEQLTVADFADPGAPSLWRSGFHPKTFGTMEKVGLVLE